MKHDITFLSADTPLTKSYSLVHGKLVKTPYPHAFHFTSHAESFSTIDELYAHLVAHALRGHCMLKGNLQRSLISESRAGTTDRNSTTTLLVFDLDRAPFKSPEAFVAAVGLADISYVVQYSASHGIVEGSGLSCHIFMMLSNPVAAPLLKQYLMRLNLTVSELRAAIELSSSHATLRWSLDITACQNDKLIYIAPPILGERVNSNFAEERIQLVQKRGEAVDVGSIKAPPLDALRKEARTLLNDRRKAAGLDALRTKTKVIGTHEVQPNPGEAEISGTKDDRGFRYFNLNGGDSWGYYHPLENFEFLHNFKGEPVYLTKELLPAYYAQCKAERSQANGTPTQDGAVYLAFRDYDTSTYWNGVYNERTRKLDIRMAKSELQLQHFMASVGRSIGEFVPIWKMVFDPHADFVLDAEKKIVNTYIKSPHLSRTHQPVDTVPPEILRVIESAVGKGEVLEHFLNWTATILQNNIKTGVAWVLHGNQGTGKGLIARMLAEILGHEYVAQRRMSELEDRYNGWIEKAQFAFIDEVEISQLRQSQKVMSDLKNLITEPTVTVRQMYRGAYPAANFTNFLLASNMSKPVTIDISDRRFNVGDYQPRRLNMNSDQMAQMWAELPQFVDYLMTREADEDKARMVLETLERQKLISRSRTSVDMVADALLEGDLPFFWDSISDSVDAMTVSSVYANAYKLLIEDLVVHFNPAGKLTRRELITIFEHCIGDMPKSPNRFTSMLRHHRVDLCKVRTSEGTVTGMYVNWRATDEWLAGRRAEIAARRAPSKVGSVKKAALAVVKA